MSKLTPVDWLIVIIYFVAILSIAWFAKGKSSDRTTLADRSLPFWICSIAFLSANLGAQEVIGMGASAAKYGLMTAHFYGIGAIPAMIFVGIFMMPFYYGSRARSVPEFLRLRFDEKTRALNACSFAAMSVISAGISLYAMARLIQALRVFDGLFDSIGWSHQNIFTSAVVLSAAIVLAYFFLGGFASAIYNEVLQFFLIVAGLLPLVLLGLKNAGGWNGMIASVGSIDPRMAHEWHGVMHAGTNPMGVNILGIGMGLGFVLGAGYWCTDFLVIQTAMASRNMDSARRVPLMAAIPKMLFPFLVIVPGLLAITASSTTVVLHNADGSITHYVNPLPQEGGLGVVPPKINPVTGEPVLDAAGKPLLDYDMATPNLLLRSFPTGILGLGLTALLASFISGIAGNLTAFNKIFTYDLYQSYIRKSATDRHYLAVGRLAPVAGMLLSIAAAFVAISFNNIMDALQLAFSFVFAPLFATFLLGMYSKRTTGHGAFAGLVCGTAAALVHHGLTLPIEAHPGIHGGWIHVVHHYPSDMAQNFYGAIAAFSVNFVVTVIVSSFTRPRPESELLGLVHSLTPKPGTSHLVWWKRPEALAVAVLLGAIALNIFFA